MMNEIDQIVSASPVPMMGDTLRVQTPKTIYDQSTLSNPDELQIGAAERTKKMGTETFKRRKNRSASQRRASMRINKSLNL